jgi:hypothetical protein
MSWRQRGAAAGKFALRNIDAILIILLAAAVLALEAIGNPKRELVDSTILALLGVMAFVLLRDRTGRDRTDEIAALAASHADARAEAVEARVDQIGSFVEDLRSDRPYQVQSDVNTWDIEAGGTQATFTKTQALLFTRNKVCTMEHWCTGTVGTVTECRAHWRLREGEQWEPVESIHDFGINSGRKYIFCLDTERSRGDALQWRVSRDLLDRFPNPTETVSLRLQTPTSRPRMQVIWPPDREPRKVEIVQDGSPTRTLVPTRNEDGRLFVDEQLAPGTDSLVKIRWTW